jgi:voltage-gated sodium channel
VARQYGDWLHMGNQVALGVFIVEALLKMLALWPRPNRYFRDGWNVFDFLVIVFALVPATGQFAMITRLARLLRVLRLISTIRDLRLIVAALVRSIPSVGHVIMLMSIVVYIYAIMGYHLFHEHDPENWRSLGISVLTLFNIITLEGWTEIMYTAMELHSLAWMYFVSFVVVGTFVVINLFIAIIINNLDEAKIERLREIEGPVSRDELLREIRATQAALQRLEERLDNTDRG